jgi:hypothetical protein
MLKIISAAILIFFGGLFLVGFLTEENLVLYKGGAKAHSSALLWVG